MRHNFRELSSWKVSFNLVKEVYLISKKLPNDEKFGLKSQIQRCAVSIPSNIAEGSGRTTDKEFLYFLNIAVSSSYELETQLLLCSELFNIEVRELIEKLEEIQRMIGGLKKKLLNTKI
ncbi:four helix bundle protein [Fluviicola sp.]|uniref:four helix bundle protein n=1 Tax=Fluviicola sp. TaxID=1917219 RepID=UPI003D26FD9F